MSASDSSPASASEADKEFSKLRYLRGFGNTFESEVVAGSLPVGRNNPRLVPFNLYTEQLSGTAFTAPRSENRRTWLYRIQPSVCCQLAADDTADSSNNNASREGKAADNAPIFGQCDPNTCRSYTNPLRWKPLKSDESSSSQSDFVSSMKLMVSAPNIAIYMYACTRGMQQTHLNNTDGDFLVVPQSSALHITTELGRLSVEPGEICVIPRGIIFHVDLPSTSVLARGYVLEIHKGNFQLPELGPIGSNGLANARDFEYPVAWCINNRLNYKQSCTILYKVSARLHSRASDHSPYSVVAWHGNYLPYKYNLSRFCAVNSVTYDHLDPSIYTVLTCQSDHTGTALADFVIFPPRVMATDPNTFRPPWFHRNCMSEFMGLIRGSYDAKEGFVPGGASLHNCMTPHGPDSSTYAKAVTDDCLTPSAFDGGLAFMFETCMPLQVSPLAMDKTWRDMNYNQCWQNLTDNFTGWDLLGLGVDKDVERREVGQISSSAKQVLIPKVE